MWLRSANPLLPAFFNFAWFSESTALKHMAFSFNQSTNFTLHCISVVIFISEATNLDKTVETLLPVLYFLGHNLPSRAMYKLSPSPPSFYVVLIMMLAHTNPVMSKTTLEEGRGREDTFAVARKFFF